MRTTRGRINPICLDGRALIPYTLYGMTECRLGRGKQVEAILMHAPSCVSTSQHTQVQG